MIVSSSIGSEDAALLRFKYRRRELTVRRVAVLLGCLGLVAMFYALVQIAGVIAANSTVGERAGGDIVEEDVLQPWEGRRGEFHRMAILEIGGSLGLALGFGVAAVGLGLLRTWGRNLTLLVSLICGALAITAIAVAITVRPIDDSDLESFPTPFFLALMALGFGLPGFAALVGFVRSRLLDPLFTEEYRRAVGITARIPWINVFLVFMLFVLIVGTIVLGLEHVREVREMAVREWLDWQK